MAKLNTMQDIHPIKEAIDIPFFSLWEWGILVFLLSFILFRVGQILWNIWMVRSRKEEKAPEPIPEYTENYFEKGLKQLGNYLETEQWKSFCHLATEFLKAHLSQKYKKNITDWTTREILNWYKKNKENDEDLRFLFQLFDPVKFAKQKAPQEKYRRAFELLQQMINSSHQND